MLAHEAPCADRHYPVWMINYGRKSGKLGGKAGVDGILSSRWALGQEPTQFILSNLGEGRVYIPIGRCGLELAEILF